MTDSRHDTPEAFEAAVGGPCFSLRDKLLAMDADPVAPLALAHALISSGIRLDLKRWNPSLPMAGVHCG